MKAAFILLLLLWGDPPAEAPAHPESSRVTDAGTFELSELAREARGARCLEDDAHEPDDGPRTDRILWGGPVERHTLCDADWMRLAAPEPMTCEIEVRKVDGDAPLVVELYEQQSSYVRTARVTVPQVGDSASLTVRLREADAYLGVFAEGSAYGPDMRYEVRARRLPSRSSAGSGVLVLPAVLQGPGAGRPVLSTDLLLSNPGFVAIDVELLLSRASGERLSRALEVPAGATRELRDVLLSAFGLDAGEGTIEIRPSGPLLAHTVLRHAAGHLLGVLGAEAPGRGVVSGEVAHLVHLDGRPPSSVSIGLAETVGASATVTIRLFDAAGAPRHERLVELPPHGYTRLELPEASTLGAGARATVEAKGDGRIHSFSLLTELGGEGSIISFHRTRGGQPVHVRPALVSVEPRITDVRVVNVGNEPAAVALNLDGTRVLPGDTPTLAPGQTLVLDDALAGLVTRAQGLLGTSSSHLIVSARARRADALAAQAPPLPAVSPSGRGRVSFLLPTGARSVFTLVGSLLDPLSATLVGPSGRTRSTAVLLPSWWSLWPPGSLHTATDLLSVLGPVEAGSRLEVEGPDYGAIRLSARVLVDGSPAEHFLEGVSLGEDLETLTITLPGEVPLVLDRVPAGGFQMGSSPYEDGRDADEIPHWVTLTEPYLMAELETTEQQWDAVMGAGNGRGARPAGGVSWDAITSPGGFLDRLNDLTATSGRPDGLRFRLPTEAEWERAARGGKSISFPVTFYCDLHSCSPCSLTWVPSVSWLPWACGGTTAEPFPTDARPFDFFRPPGPLGLHDMQGNLWEWVSDRYGPYDVLEPVVDPAGPAEGDLRVIRGGSYQSLLKLCRSGNRYGYPPSEAYRDVGFRVVLAPAR